MYIRSWGSRQQPLVVLLHAQGCHGGWWDEVGPLLAEAGYHVVAPDLRGHGQSEWADSYGWNDYAADVELLATQPYALVGHSMGGYIGLQVAARGVKPPELLVVIDMKLEASAQELTELLAASRRPGKQYGTLEEAVERYRLAPAGHCVPTERLRRMAADSFRQEPNGSWAHRFDRRALAIEPLHPMALAERITCPTLVVRGEHSEIMPREGALALTGALKGQFAEMAGCFHHLPLEAPAALAEAVRAFLA